MVSYKNTPPSQICLNLLMTGPSLFLIANLLSLHTLVSREHLTLYPTLNSFISLPLTVYMVIFYFGLHLFYPTESNMFESALLSPVLVLFQAESLRAVWLVLFGFNLFINDITDNLDSSTTSKIFADDIKLYTEFSTTISPQHLQTHLDLINQWSITWQLPISHSKCNILVLGRHALNQPFSIYDVTVPTVDFNLDLGVTVDSDLKFTTHITNIVKKAKQRSALIHRCFLSRNIPNLIRAFQTYVRPIVEYATHIWSPHFLNSINLIESVQRSFTKRLPGLGDFSYHERLSILELKSLEHWRLIFDLILCYNIVHGHNSSSFNDFFSFSNNPSSRGHSLKLAFPTAKSDIRKYFFSTRVVKIWNALPTNIVHAPSTHSFKSLLSYHDLTNFFVIPTFIVTK